MKTCLKPNYQENLHSGEINFSSIKVNNLEELLNSIEMVLEEVSFSTNLDSSENSDTYEQSIKDMTKTVIKELERQKLPFELTRIVKSQIRSFIASKDLPKPLTQVEQNIQAVIPGSDIISESERRELKFKEVISEIYGNNTLSIDNTRQTQFYEDIMLKTIIDIRTRNIIDNVYKLCK